MAADTMQFTLKNDAGSTLFSFNLPLFKLDATTAPTSADDGATGGYVAGSLWVDRTNDKVYVCTDNGTTAAVWVQIAGTGAGGGSNALLDGANHTDTVAQGVTRGSLVYGNATPKWDELTVGAANALLGTDGTDVSWFGCTAAGRAILDDADAAAQRTTLGLGALATLGNGTAISVLGRAANSSGDRADIAATESSGAGLLVFNDDNNVIEWKQGTGAAWSDSSAIELGTLPMLYGGTGAALADPGADRIMFWDDSGGAVTWLTAGTGLSITTTTLDLDATLAALALYNTNGLLTQTSADTFTGRTITGTANEIAVTNGGGVAGDPTLSLPTDFRVPGAFALSGVINITLGANQDDWNPAGLSTAEKIRVTLNVGDVNITGLVGSISGETKTIVNLSSTYYIYLKYSSGSSSAANRFIFGGGADVVIPPRGSFTVIYDSTTGVWREIALDLVPVGRGGTGAVNTTNARANLGLGTSAVLNTGTSGTSVALTDGANQWSQSQRFINSSGITILDTDASHTTGIIGGSNLTANRTLTITTGDANRTLTLSADLTVSTATTLDSGVYTPTLFNTTNVASSTASQCQYMRVGSVVTVSGTVTIDPTAAASTTLGMSIPIASNFGAVEDAGGTAVAPLVAGQCASITADSTNDRVLVRWVAVDLGSRLWGFSFTYRII